VADKGRQSWWDIPLTLLIAFGIVLLITTFIAKPFSIPSGSMEDTLQVGDRVLVNKVVYHLRPIERGDVVVFDGTDSFVPATEIAPKNPIQAVTSWLGQSVGLVAPDGTDFVKRVIGVGGDHVVCCNIDGRLTINGVAIDESAYLYPGASPSDQPFDVIVPSGMLWLMGDHRDNSADSRSHLGDPGGGMVPESRVIGRTMNVLWPLNRISNVPIPDAFASVPAPDASAVVPGG
jgi:signal peptidase I